MGDKFLLGSIRLGPKDVNFENYGHLGDVEIEYVLWVTMAKLADLQEKLEAWRIVGKEYYNYYPELWSINESLGRLRELGEIE